MRRAKNSRQGLSIALVFFYIFQLIPTPSFAQSSQNSSFKLPISIIAKDLKDLREQLSDEEKELVSKMFEEPLAESTENLMLLKRLQEKEAQLTQILGKEELQKQIRSRQEKYEVSITIPGVGRAEIVCLGKGENARTFQRVVNNRTAVAYHYVDLDTLPLDQIENINFELTEDNFESDLKLRKYLSFQLRNYIARQAILSGRGKDAKPKDLESAKKKAQFALSGNADELVKSNLYRNLSKDKSDAFAENTKFADMPAMGRDQVVVFHRSGQHIETSQHKSPRSKWELSFWKNYWYSIYERPDYNAEYWNQGFIGKVKTAFTGDYLLGLFYASLQATVALSLGGLQQIISPNNNLAENTFTAMAITSLGFGIVLGVFTKTFQNWNKIGGLKSQSIKSWAVSLSYGFVFALQTQGIAGMNIFNANGSYNMAAITMYFLIFTNTVIKGWFKTWSMQIPYFKRDAGESLNDFIIPNRIKIPLPFGKKIDFQFMKEPFNTKIERSGIDNQNFQLLGTIPKVAHLANMQLHLPMAGNVPAGQILYPLLIPVFHYWTVRYAENYVEKAKHSSTSYNSKHIPAYEQKAILFRKSWEDSKLLGIPYLNTVSVGLGKTLANYTVNYPKYILKNTVLPIAKKAAAPIFAVALASSAKATSYFPEQPRNPEIALIHNRVLPKKSCKSLFDSEGENKL